jgi:hypothetical protein
MGVILKKGVSYCKEAKGAIFYEIKLFYKDKQLQKPSIFFLEC